MYSKRRQNDEFFKKFGWVRCLHCLAPISREHRTLLLSCRHTFCAKCFQRGNIFKSFPKIDVLCNILVFCIVLLFIQLFRLPNNK